MNEQNDQWGLQEIIKNQTDEIDRLRQRVAELEALLLQLDADAADHTEGGKLYVLVDKDDFEKAIDAAMTDD